MNYPVNRTDLKLFKGLQTKVHVLLKNIDRKPVALANGQYLVIQVYDRVADVVVFEKALTQIDQAQALWQFVVEPNELADWEVRTVSYLVMIHDSATNKRTPIYTDRNYTTTGILDILDGPLVPATDPIELTPSTFITRGDYTYSAAQPGAAQSDNPSGQHTAVIYGTSFNGKVMIQATLDSEPTADDSQWTDIITEYDTTDLDGTHQFSFEGNFMWVRFRVFTRPPANLEDPPGTLDRILFRN